MGILYEAVCPACDYKRCFSLGSGLNAMDLFRSIRVLNSAQQEQIVQMKERKEISDFSVENRLVRCRRCPQPQGLMEKTIITITDTGLCRHVFGAHCNVCGDTLELIDNHAAERSDTVVCPKCEKGFLTFRRAGFWD